MVNLVWIGVVKLCKVEGMIYLKYFEKNFCYFYLYLG